MFSWSAFGISWDPSTRSNDLFGVYTDLVFCFLVFDWVLYNRRVCMRGGVLVFCVLSIGVVWILSVNASDEYVIATKRASGGSANEGRTITSHFPSFFSHLNLDIIECCWIPVFMALSATSYWGLYHLSSIHGMLLLLRHRVQLHIEGRSIFSQYLLRAVPSSLNSY